MIESCITVPSQLTVCIQVVYRSQLYATPRQLNWAYKVVYMVVHTYPNMTAIFFFFVAKCPILGQNLKEKIDLTKNVLRTEHLPCAVDAFC